MFATAGLGELSVAEGSSSERRGFVGDSGRLLEDPGEGGWLAVALAPTLPSWLVSRSRLVVDMRGVVNRVVARTSSTEGPAFVPAPPLPGSAPSFVLVLDLANIRCLMFIPPVPVELGGFALVDLGSERSNILERSLTVFFESGPDIVLDLVVVGSSGPTGRLGSVMARVRPFVGLARAWRS